MALDRQTFLQEADTRWHAAVAHQKLLHLAAQSVDSGCC